MRWLKRLGYVVAGLALVIVAAVGFVYARSQSRFNKPYTVVAENVPLLTDSASIARGQHFAQSIGGCTDCHGEGLGGNVFVDDPGLGRLTAPNLTAGDGGLGGTLTPALLERAIRHGVGPDGRALRVMPAIHFQYMSDADLVALVAYVKSRPPRSSASLPPTSLKFLARALLVTNQMPLLPAEQLAVTTGGPMTPTVAPTADYGSYLAHVAGCAECHGAAYSGGKIDIGPPTWPAAANLTPSGNLGKWTEAQFKSTLRTGKRPDGSAVNAAMPFRVFGTMTDDEMHALWLYLQSLPARPFGTH